MQTRVASTVTRYPAPLRPGDRIGVTAPSSPVPPRLRARLDLAVALLREQGYDVVLGECLLGDGMVSGTVGDRAGELTAMLTDPDIRAVVPPWGGEVAIDLVGALDWDAIGAAEPTWLVGYSDIATLITPLTMLTGVATVHGFNLMDTPYRTPPGLLSLLDVLTAEPGSTLVQEPPGRHRAAGHDDWAVTPGTRDLVLDGAGRWEVLSAGDGSAHAHARAGGERRLRVSGRMIGGCIETLGPLAGSRYLDGTAYARMQHEDGLLVYVEAAQSQATDIARHLHGMRLSGFFDGARAVLVGRSGAPDGDGYTQRQAVLDALGPLGVPIVAGVECGHVAPWMPIVNGSLGLLEVGAGTDRLTQHLV